MNRDEIQTRLALFVAVVLVAVAAVAAAGVVVDRGSTERPTADRAGFQPDAIETSELERGGEIAIDGGSGSKTIVIDAAHANDFSRGDLQPVVSALTAAGHTVTYHEFEEQPGAQEGQRARELADSLSEADALIAVEPETRYSAGEADVVSEFALGGGRVLFAAGPETGGGAIVAVPQGPMGPQQSTTTDNGEFASVTSSLGIAYDTGYLYDMTASGTHYQTVAATPETNSALTDDVDRVVFDAPTPVETDGRTLLTTAETVEHSETRETDAYGVVVRNGNAVGVGDVGFMTSANHNVADNEVLIGNLLEFLVSGSKTPGVPSAPGDIVDGGPGAEPPAGFEAGTGSESAPAGQNAG